MAATSLDDGHFITDYFIDNPSREERDFAQDPAK